jgi:hypothetical protein
MAQTDTVYFHIFSFATTWFDHKTMIRWVNTFNICIVYWLFHLWYSWVYKSRSIPLWYYINYCLHINTILNNRVLLFTLKIKDLKLKLCRCCFYSLLDLHVMYVIACNYLVCSKVMNFFLFFFWLFWGYQFFINMEQVHLLCLVWYFYLLLLFYYC